MPNETQSKSRLIFIALLLGAITFLLYLPVKDAKFLIFDDNIYVAENVHVVSGMSMSGLKWAFTTGAAANYHPVTWLSHQLDCTLFGLNSGKQHLMNVFIHSVNSMLLLFLLFRLTGGFWRSAIVAALFAWHPMHVESVAWIAERKDTLSTFFWILTVWAYCAYAKKTSPLKYVLVLLLYILALLSKPMVVTLPFLLLLLDYWPLDRIRTAKSKKADFARQLPFSALVKEKIPLMLLSVVDSFVTFYVQKADGAMESMHTDFGVRLINTPISYFRYLVKLAWPQHLGVLYPYEDHPDALMFLLACIVLGIITKFALGNLATKRYCFVGWCWFLGVLVPTIGIIQVGEQSIADRYTYIPGVGLFIMLVWLVADYASKSKSLKIAAGVLSVLMLGACLALARKQIGYWDNSMVLFEHEIAATGSTAIGEYHLAFIYHDMGREQDAVDHYEKSLRMDPSQYLAHNNLGASLGKLGRHQDATNHIARALELRPDLPLAHLNYANSLEALGDYVGAVYHYQECLRMKPDSAGCHYKLGILYFKQGQLALAKVELEQALSLDPSQSDIYLGLGDLYNAMQQGREAIANYEQGLKLNPDSVIMLNDLAWLRAANADPILRNGAEAVKLAKRACELTQSTQPYLLGTLADAYAEAGQFDEAIATAQKAIAKAIEGKLPQVAERNIELIELYKSHQAFHESPPTAAPAAK